MIKFSIIIPVFNSEKTIRRCLDSIIKQTYKNFEVLVMDDGSFDNSLNICTEYQLKDERFKVYSQKNSGPSEARNYCLNQSTGSWICFVDSDDWIGEDYLESLCNEITQNNPEIIFIGYKATNIITNHTNIKVPSFLNVNDSYYMSLLKLSEQDMFGYTWIKIIRKDVIQGVRFKSELSLFEDEIFTCEVLKNCTKINYVSKALYNYTTGDSFSLIEKTYSDYSKKCEMVYEAWMDLLVQFENKELYLEKKANKFVEQCKYYAFERDVNLKKFFKELANTSFFKQHSSKSNMDKYIYKQKYFLLIIEKIKYKLKIKVAKVLRRKK